MEVGNRVRGTQRGQEHKDRGGGRVGRREERQRARGAKRITWQRVAWGGVCEGGWFGGGGGESGRRDGRG